jgi:4'-phosphopantetheinyl transferase
MNLTLAVDEIHLWLADLDQPPRPLSKLAATLTQDEQERAARFRFPEHQARFIAGRGLLRELLGGYLNRPAAALRFCQGAHGKPELAGKEAAAGLHFNLAHSGHRALYAVARREVGVDLEKPDRSADYAAIIARICGLRERAAFQTIPPEQRQNAFFACWTCKEAIAKALGSGFASGLQTLDVCFLDGDRAKLHDPAGREWAVMNVPLEPGWAGALAAVGADWRWISIPPLNYPGDNGESWPGHL